MSLLYKLLIFTSFAFIIARTINPSGEESQVLITDIDKKGKNYKYYELDRSGLGYSELGNFSDQDSVRVKFYIREVFAEDNGDKQKFKVDLKINSDTKRLSYSNKKKSKYSQKNRPGRSISEPGIWYSDIRYSEFKNLSINRVSGENLIIRAVVEKIDRSDLTGKTIETINNQKKHKIDTRSNRTGKIVSRKWYKISERSDKLKFEVVGPTSIRVFSRVGNPSHDSNSNDYSLFIKEDGLDIGTFYFTTELSSLSNIHDTGEKISKWRTCWINVPKGKHYYTISQGVTLLREPALQANLQDEIYSPDSPIFVRVKRYDEN